MSSNWGKNIKISVFGESHGKSIGVVIDGLPSGISLDLDEIKAFMQRRAPGRNAYSTHRKELDRAQIQSGFVNGHTTGTPLCAMIENADTRSKDYMATATLARPSHADYTGYVRYGGYNDIRGGGHFSGRLTAPLVFAGAVALQILATKGITVGAHIHSIYGVKDAVLDPVTVTHQQLEEINTKPFPTVDDAQGEKMIAAIDDALNQQDSLGGIVSCYAVGMPVGIGSPMFDGLENTIASLVFGIPAVKGIEFGAGFASGDVKGSENNDPNAMKNGEIVTTTNNHGGIIGGISSGMPIVLRVAFKPTASISQPQNTVDFIDKTEQTLLINGRHDPCIVPRAVPCTRACVAIALLDSIMEGR